MDSAPTPAARAPRFHRPRDAGLAILGSASASGDTGAAPLAGCSATALATLARAVLSVIEAHQGAAILRRPIGSDLLQQEGREPARVLDVPDLVREELVAAQPVVNEDHAHRLAFRLQRLKRGEGGAHRAV